MYGLNGSICGESVSLARRLPPLAFTITSSLMRENASRRRGLTGMAMTGALTRAAVRLVFRFIIGDALFPSSHGEEHA